MAGIIKNSGKHAKIILPKVDLKGFQRLETFGNKISSVTSEYRTFSIDISIDKFLDCLCGKTIEQEIIYKHTELQCQYCVMGLTDWIQNAMKKPIFSFVRDSLFYQFGEEEVLLYDVDVDIKWILARPYIKDKKEPCRHCKGTGLYEVINLKDKMKLLQLDKDIILKELGGNNVRSNIELE